MDSLDQTAERRTHLIVSATAAIAALGAVALLLINMNAERTKAAKCLRTLAHSWRRRPPAQMSRQATLKHVSDGDVVCSRNRVADLSLSSANEMRS
jgi:hypothetical protein